MPKTRVRRLILPILLLASLVLNLGQTVQIGMLRRVDIPSVVGTYVASTAPDGGRHYVLEQNGVCAVYEPMGDVEKGTYYLADDATVESPLTMRFPSQTLCVLRVFDRLYLYDPEGSIILLRKVSDSPTYISVEH